MTWAPAGQSRMPLLARLIVASAAALLLGAGAGSAGALEADGKVHDLTDSSFAAAVGRHKLAFVEFYAPWCGHCKKLVPEWEKVAKLAQRSGIPVAKVDAIAEKKLAESNGIKSFPTLRLFRNGPEVSKLYEGPRTAEKMAEWLELWHKASLLEPGPAGESPSADALRSWARAGAGAGAVAVVGLLGGSDAGQDEAMQEVLRNAAFALNSPRPGSELPVTAATVAAKELEALGMSDAAALPSVALFRNFDLEEGVVFYRPKAAAGWKAKDAWKDFMEWIEGLRVPALIPGNEKTEKFFLQGSAVEIGNGLVVLFGGDVAAKTAMHQAALKFAPAEQRLKWVHVQDNDFGTGLGKSVGIDKKDFPEVVIWQFGETEDDDKTFRLSQQEDQNSIELKSLETLVTRWQDGDLSAEKDPVITATTDSFEEIVIRNKKDVMVEFYAPWCGHCKALAPEYKQLAQHYEKDLGISIVKVDATKHRHHTANVSGYPTLHLYLADDKETPLNPGFQGGRTKQSLIDYIEKHRTTTKKGKKKKQSASKDGPSPPPAAPQAAAPVAAGSGSAAASASAEEEGEAGEGVWAFDDSADPASLGKLLSADMVASRAGNTLVRVGGVGLLILQDARTLAVRRFPSAAAAASAAGRSGGAASAPAASGALPCPENADTAACQAWCEGVSPTLRGSLAGARCKDLKKGASPDDWPQCNCYDSEYTVLHAMCRSVCDDGSSGSVLNAVASAAASPSTTSSAPAAASEDGTCAAGDASCMANVAGDSKAKTRYFLYDVKYGEGFNLQREVYPRAGWIVAELNKEVERRCGSRTGGAGCARWKLVLPPWCRVVHWWSDSKHLPWGTFFDMDALKKAKIPMIEFEEYVKVVGGQTADLVITYGTDDKEISKDAKLTGALGEFHGFAGKYKDCAAKNRELPEHTVDKKTGEFKFVYAGQCKGGLRVKDFKCGKINGPWPRGVVDMLRSLDDGVTSVLVKGYDYLLSPENAELDELGLRESMLFSKEIRGAGDAFVSTALGGRPYVAAHCRRTDFLRVRAKSTPGADAIAGKLNEILAQTNMDQVFIATDAPDDLRDDLRQKVKGKVVFYDADAGAKEFDHPGKKAGVEMWVASRADFFVGSIESRFTMWIQLERGFLGKPKATTEQEFCKDYTDGKKKCLAPAYRHPAKKGRHRGAYQKK